MVDEGIAVALPVEDGGVAVPLPLADRVLLVPVQQDLPPRRWHLAGLDLSGIAQQEVADGPRSGPLAAGRLEPACLALAALAPDHPQRRAHPGGLGQVGELGGR